MQKNLRYLSFVLFLINAFTQNATQFTWLQEFGCVLLVAANVPSNRDEEQAAEVW